VALHVRQAGRRLDIAALRRRQLADRPRRVRDRGHTRDRRQHQLVNQDIWLRRSVELPATRLDPSTLQLLVFHDEDLEIYFDDVLAARASGFVRDYEPMDILPTPAGCSSRGRSS